MTPFAQGYYTFLKCAGLGPIKALRRHLDDAPLPGGPASIRDQWGRKALPDSPGYDEASRWNLSGEPGVGRVGKGMPEVGGKGSGQPVHAPIYTPSDGTQFTEAELAQGINSGAIPDNKIPVAPQYADPNGGGLLSYADLLASFSR